MGTTLKTRALPRVGRMSESRRDSANPDELKILVRDGLASMTADDREAFILALENQLRPVNVNIRQHLVPLGISASSLQELTPSDIAHLVRFLKINMPTAMLAVDGLINQFVAGAEKFAKAGDRLVA